MRSAWTGTAAVFVLAQMTAGQEVALKNLMPKGMVIGVAINQRQSDGVDTAAVDIITKQFNQISPENALKFGIPHCAESHLAFGGEWGHSRTNGYWMFCTSSALLRHAPSVRIDSRHGL